MLLPITGGSDTSARAWTGTISKRMITAGRETNTREQLMDFMDFMDRVRRVLGERGEPSGEFMRRISNLH
jgi:hypothetical protein